MDLPKILEVEVPKSRKCPTCGPTTVEYHPRQPGVIRCSNCKEWVIPEWPHMVGGISRPHEEFPDFVRIEIRVLNKVGETQAWVEQSIHADDLYELMYPEIFAWLMNEMVERLEEYLEENKKIDG